MTLGLGLATVDGGGRVGGDEFAIILHEAGEAEATTVAEKILDAIRRGGLVQHAPHQARVTSSIGITTLDANIQLTGAELVVEADTAMGWWARRRG